MAEINIEPRKKNFNWLWILGIALLLGLVIWIFNSKNDRDNNLSQNRTEESADRNAGTAGGVAGGIAASSENAWENVNWKASNVKRPEVNINSRDFEMRGDDNYTRYSLGENLLFETDKATLSSKAENNLKQIAASIKQRYGEGQVRVYGYADARADDAHNMELSEQRAEAVKDWLVNKGGLDRSKISLQPKGESNPVASNETAGGQKQNRRVEIVAINK
jgi:outer membrane protein OmpA-like peptidoglycan-associated protein